MFGTTTPVNEDDLPARLNLIYSDGENLFFYEDNRECPLVKEDFSIDSKEELVEYRSLRFFDRPFDGREFHCGIQTKMHTTPEYIHKDKLEERLAELGTEAVKNAKSFLDEGKEDEAEKLLWFAARAMPKSASVLMLLRIVLKGKISEEEMNVLNQKIEELMVV